MNSCNIYHIIWIRANLNKMILNFISQIKKKKKNLLKSLLDSETQQSKADKLIWILHDHPRNVAQNMEK